jgi:fluoride exporter
MFSLSLVALGGAVGAVARVSLSSFLNGRLAGAGGWPWGTFAVNLAGCFLIGLLVGVLAGREGPHDGVRQFLGPGVLGGFTTFSAFSIETVELIERGRAATALAYALGSVAVGVALALLGLLLGRKVAG